MAKYEIDLDFVKNKPESLDLYKQLVQQYFQENYNTTEIVVAAGIKTGIWKSVRTVQRYMKDLGLVSKRTESPVDEIIQAIQSELENTGRRLGVHQIWQRIRRQYGLHVKRETVRHVVRIIEPSRAAEMKKGRLERRKYTVRGPNHIWHIDGNDKLKPYGFGISGAIDGWSRKLIWLDVDETNKNPLAICTYYINALQSLKKIPLIVRMDRGTENVTIADVHTLLRSTHDDDFSSCAVMFGSSNHNQRIERFWHYLRQVLLQSYIDLFKDLELSGILQTDNILHIECLKFCFMQVIRQELKSHLRHWNTHRVRRMKNVTSPSGIPNFMYDTPECYGCTDQGRYFDETTVEHCRGIYNYQRNENGCQDMFSEWALSLMLHRQWNLPTNLSEAFDLFSKLIIEIYANDQ